MLSGAPLTRFLHGRAAAVLASALAVAALAVYYLHVPVEHMGVDKGFVFPSANNWFAGRGADFAAGLCAFGATLLIATLLCKVYNVLRSLSWLYVVLFAATYVSTPELGVQFYGGSMLVLAVGACIMLLLGTWRNPEGTRRVFLIFAILSGLCTTQYCYLFYLPVFAIGCMQMQIFNFRTAVAMLLGLITPWWIIFGLGIAAPAQVHLPQFSGITLTGSMGQTVLTLLSVGVSALLIVLSFVLNVLRTIAYNARARAVNGVIAITSLFTIAACAVDFTNIITYIPLLDFCAALSTAHYFATHRAENSGFALVGIVVVYTVLYICQTAI